MLVPDEAILKAQWLLWDGLRVLAEPMTAVLTLALAFVSATAWEIGWLMYPLIARALRRAGIGISTNVPSQ